MIIDLKPLLCGEKRELNIEETFDISGLTADIVSGKARLCGKCVDRIGFVDMSLDVELELIVSCSRCAADHEFKESYKMEYPLVTALDNEDTDEFILLSDGKLDLLETATEFILINLPSVYLCDEDCKGLCPKCGKDLNHGECGCEHKEIDPRLAGLADFFKNK
jgi:uncharacterized protein